MKLLSIETFYVAAGGILFAVAARVATDPRHPRRWGSAFFWLLLAITFAVGKWLPPSAVGYLVVGMVILAATGQVAPGPHQEASREQRLSEAERLGNRLFQPALLIPTVAIVGALLLGRVPVGGVGWVDPKQ